jgi:predicted ATP-dependent serine protease
MTPAPFERAATPPPRRVDEVLRSEWRTRRTYSTGFPKLDEKIGGGFKARQLALIPAPTGVGKTGLVGTIALHNARAGVPVLWVLGELDPQEQTARFGALRLRQEVNSTATADQILGGQVPIASVQPLLDGLPIYLLDLDDVSVDRFAMIADQARQITETHGQPPIIVVDYVQCLVEEGP